MDRSNDGRGVHSGRRNRYIRAGHDVGKALDNAAYWATQAQVALEVAKHGEAAFLLGRAQGWIEEAKARYQSMDELHSGDAGQEAQVSASAE